MKLIEYPDREMMAVDLAQVLTGELETVLLHEDRATLVLPGGETPGAVFDVLCAARIEWDRVDVTLSDERWLPEVHVRSNTRMLRQRFLVDRAAAAVFHPLYAKAEEPDDVIADLEASLIPCMPVSVLLLGMGDDMHTASLFPDGNNLDLALDHTKAPMLVSMKAPSVSETRISFSARTLNNALHKHVVISGRSKRNALDRAIGRDPQDAPVAAILENCTVHWAP